jgi:peptide/nickel transport system substrate-binding protein
VVITALLAACGGTPTPAPTTAPTAAPTKAPVVEPTKPPAAAPTATTAAVVPTKPPAVQRIPVLNVGQLGNPVDLTCWDWTANDELDILQHFAEPLFRFDRDGKLVGVAAESWEMKTPMDWTIKVRKGMKFQDPKYGEVKAADVIASLDWCFKKDGRALPKQPGVVSGMKLTAVDDYTVRVELPTPGSAGLPNNWLYTAITSKQYLDEVGKDFNRKPMGAGPFKFVEWVPNVRIVGERFADYYGPDPGVDRIVWKVLTDAFTRKSEFLTGGIDILPFMDASWLTEIKANTAVRVEPILSARYIMVILPCKDPPFTDKKLRQALNYAINKDEIAKQLFQTVGAVVPSGVLNPVIPESDPKKIVYPYDLAKAKALLAESQAAGTKIGTITLYATNDRYSLDKEMGEAVAGYWRALGLKVEYVPQARTILLPKSQAFEMHDPHQVGFGNAQMRADYPFNLWLQSRTNPRSRGDAYVGAPKEWDVMIDQLASMASGAPETTKLARQLDDLFIDYAPWAFVTNYVDLYGVSNKVNWKPYSYEMRYFVDVTPRK